MTFKAVGVAINMDDDTFEVPIAYIPPLPRNFYQCHPFYFISDPQKTQARFEHDVMNGK